MSIIFIVFIVGWLLNLAWEFWHVRFYTKGGSFQRKMPYPWFLLFATTWDAGYITIVYLSMSFLHKSFAWIGRANVLDVLTVLVVGIVTATYIERRSLRRGKWEYASNMPIVPIVRVGLTPFVQLAFLSLLTYSIISLLSFRT